MTKLQKQYEDSCNAYIDKFCKKQDMEFAGWVGGQVGGIAVCADFFFNFLDIVWDINSKQPKGEIVQWYYGAMEESVNYFNYTKINEKL